MESETRPKNISVEIPTECKETPLPRPYSVSKATYHHLGKKDEAHILRGIRAFKPLYIIAQELGVCRHTLYSYLRNKMDLSYRDMKESMIDVAESKLFRNIIDGNQNAIEFFLDRQAKNRGYGIKEVVDRQDVPIIQIGKIEVNNADENPNNKKETIDAEVVNGNNKEEKEND